MHGNDQNLDLSWRSLTRLAGNLLSAGSTLAARFSPWQMFSRRKLVASFAEVEAAAGDLKEVSDALEQRFLETANLVLALDEQGRGFVTESEKLVNVATGQQGGAEIFHQAMAVLDPPLQFLTESHRQMSALLKQLKQDNERITALINGRDELQRTVAPLKYIQTSFRIESAPLGEEVQLMFSALTQEIDKLHQQICELFSTRYEHLQHIQQTIHRVILKLEVQTEEVWKKISREQAQANKSLAELQTQLADNRKREAGIANLSSELAEGIQDVVIGLQFQDLFSQRLQRATQSLHDVRQQYDGSPAGVVMMEQACRSQSEQLKAMRRELAGAERAVKHGVQNVLEQITEADQKCVTLREFECLTVSANGMVQVLLDVFATVQKQVDITASGCSSAFEILRPIGTMASDLTMVVNELSQRIHLIGLNAQIQAAQVPDGMGLEVLSARTSEISRATNQISETMAVQLQQLVAGLTQNLQALEQLQAAASGEQASLGQKAGECEQRLHWLRDNALASLTSVHGQLDDIRANGKLVLATANYVDAADAGLLDLEEKLNAVSALAGNQFQENRSPAKNSPRQQSENRAVAVREESPMLIASPSHHR